MKNRERLLWIVLLSVALFFSPGLSLLRASADPGESHKYQQLLQNVFYYVQNYYVEPKDERTLWLGAIRGILNATGDPYTRFLDREAHREFNAAEGGQKVGIGVEISMQDGIPVVIAPIEGGPAEKAGILAGDRIVKVAGVATDSVPFNKLLDLISGEVDTVVEIQVERSGPIPTRTVQITRGLFDLDYVYSGILDNGKIGYVRLTHFMGEDGGSVDEFRKALEGFAAKKVSGVVVDLRNNAGGHLDMATRITGFFLKEGDPVVRVRGRDKELDRDILASGETEIIPESMPVAVLINGGSASASEVMSGALQDHKRAILVGTRSFGKGSVQQVFRPLPDDTAALITIQKYFTPANRSIHGKGLDPDLEIRDFAPDLDESYALAKLKKEDFFTKFKKSNPDYSEDLPALFAREVTRRGLKLGDQVIRQTLHQMYPGKTDNIPDPGYDLQLAGAIKSLEKKL